MGSRGPSHPKCNGGRGDWALRGGVKGLFPSLGEGLSSSLGRGMGEQGTVPAGWRSPPFLLSQGRASAWRGGWGG